MAVRHLSENRHIDPHFRIKVWARFESVSLKEIIGCFNGGLSLGCLNKMPRTVGLKKETFIYQSSGGWQDQDQGAG